MKLNHHDLEVGFDATLRLLQATRPLHEAFDSITTYNPPYSLGAFVNVEIIPRDAKIYHIYYATSGHKYSLQLSYLRESFMWVLKDISSPDKTQQWPKLQEELQAHVFEKKCHEWTGLGNGALAGAATVGFLIQAIHRVIRTHGPTTPHLSSDIFALQSGVKPLRREGGSGHEDALGTFKSRETQPEKDTDL
ncbi:mediator complex subunit, partial [Ascosphaera aggregata]